MKIRFLMIFALLFAMNLAWAQEEPIENEGDMKQLKAALQLSKEQAKQWKAIHAEFHPKIKALKESNTPRPEKHEQIKALKDAKDAKLKEALSEEQWAKLVAHREAKKAERKENKGNGPKGNGPKGKQ